MLKILSVINRLRLFFYLCPIIFLFSIESYSQEKILIPFSYVKPTIIKTCGDDLNEIDRNNCIVNTYECSMEAPVVVDNDAKLIIKIGESIRSKINLELYQEVKTSLYRNRDSNYVATLRKDSKVTLFTHDTFKKEYSAYEPFDFPEDGTLELNELPKTEMVPIRLELAEESFEEKDVSVKIRVFGNTPFLFLSKSMSSSIKVSKGRHPIYVEWFKNKIKYEKKIEIDTSQKPNSDGFIVYKIDSKDFKASIGHTFKENQIEWNKEKKIFKFRNSGSKKYGMNSISKLQVKENNADISQFFEVDKGEIKLSDSFGFLESTKGFLNFNVEVEGKCFEMTKKSTITNKLIYSSSKKTDQLGLLDVYVSEKKIISNFISNDGEVKAFNPNVQSKIFSDFHVSFVHEAKEKKNDLINLGRGPWGNEGWIENKKVFIPEDYKLDDFKESRYSELGRLLHLIATSPKHAGDEEDRLVYERINDKKNGLEKLKLINIKKMININWPEFVDLSGRAFVGDGKKRSYTLKLFDDPGHMKNLGEIEFIREGEIVKTIFKSSGNKMLVPFESDFSHGFCDSKNPFVSMQSINAKLGEHVRIGEGPWGKFAWVRLKSYKFSDINFPLELSYQGERIYSHDLVKKNIFTFYTRSITSEENKKHILSIKKLYDEDSGILKLKPLCSYSFDGNTNLEPRYVELLSTKVKLDHKIETCIADSSNRPCRSYQESKKCEFLTPVFHDNYRRQSLDVEINEKVDQMFFILPGLKETNFASSNHEHRLHHFEGILKNSRVDIYTFNKKMNQSIELGAFSVNKTDSSNITKITYPTNFQSVDWKIDSNTKYISAKLFLGMQELGELDEKNPLQLKLGLGKYEFRVVFEELNSLPKEFYYTVDVNEYNNDINTMLVSNMDDLPIKKSLSYSSSTGRLNLNLSGADYSSLKSFDSFNFYASQNMNLDAYLSEKDKLQVKSENISALETIMNEKNGVLSLQGMCSVKSISPLVGSYKIFDKPNDTEKEIGVLNYVYRGEHDVNIYYLNLRGDHIKFKPNLFLGSCYDEKVLILHQVTEFNDDWSNLGEGPWGKNGWIKKKSASIYGSDLNFSSSGVGAGKLKKSSHNKIEIVPDLDYDAKPQVLESKDIINSKGQINLPFTCEYGC